MSTHQIVHIYERVQYEYESRSYPVQDRQVSSKVVSVAIVNFNTSLVEVIGGFWVFSGWQREEEKTLCDGDTVIRDTLLILMR